MAIGREAIIAALCKSFESAQVGQVPYRHWLLSKCLPEDCIDAINDLPIEAPDLNGLSGKRELHNATRSYFDVETQNAYPVTKAFAEAFQDRTVTDGVRDTFGAHLDNTYLRIEYALDIDGFWLEPHTDLGVKMFTMLLYTSRDAAHADLGTDIYDTDKTRVGRSPFEANSAFTFVPSDITFHGFQKRHIEGVRKSIIINYVTKEWRAREQLAFPDQPITAPA